MADKIIIEGVRRYDGEYELDLAGEPLTNLERRWIKKIADYVGPEVSLGWARQDPDLFVALAVIVMVRAGKIREDQALSVAREFDHVDSSAIRLVVDVEAEDEDPTTAPEPVEKQSESLNSRSETSGGHSSLTSDPPGPTPSATGSPDSPRSATSDPATLVI